MDEDGVFDALKKYRYVVSAEEAYINKGGLDTLILNILAKRDSGIKVRQLGFHDSHVFEMGSRDYLHKMKGLDVSGMVKTVKACLK